MHGRSGEQRLARQTSLRPSGTGGTVGRGMLCGSFVSARTATRPRRWRSSSAGRGPAAMCGNSRIDRCTENPSKNAIRTVNFANGSNIVAGTSVTAVYDKVSRSNLCPAPSSALASRPDLCGRWPGRLVATAAEQERESQWIAVLGRCSFSSLSLALTVLMY
jgi:hypothetical protein